MLADRGKELMVSKRKVEYMKVDLGGLVARELESSRLDRKGLHCQWPLGFGREAFLQ